MLFSCGYKLLLKLVPFLLFIFIQCAGCTSKIANTAIVVSISSDGHYAISSHLTGTLVLWDLRSHSKQIIAKHVNIYSAYFIKNTDSFIWQDDETKQIIIENVLHQRLKTFSLNFHIYGHVITHDLEHYFASNENWDLVYFHDQLVNIAHGYQSFIGSGKLLNLTLSNDEKYLLSAGEGGLRLENIPLASNEGKYNLSGVVLWKTSTQEPLFKLLGNKKKTIATFSPDNQFIISGDENNNSIIFSTKTGKKYKEGASTLLYSPAYFKEIYHFSPAIFALKFIDNQKHYLRFTTNVTTAVLYSIDSNYPINYFQLGRHPSPMVNDYAANSAIDTAPNAHLLVMGQSNFGSGIIVYQFDSKRQQLVKTWAPDGP